MANGARKSRREKDRDSSKEVLPMVDYDPEDLETKEFVNVLKKRQQKKSLLEDVLQYLESKGLSREEAQAFLKGESSGPTRSPAKQSQTKPRKSYSPPIRLHIQPQ